MGERVEELIWFASRAGFEPALRHFRPTSYQVAHPRLMARSDGSPTKPWTPKGRRVREARWRRRTIAGTSSAMSHPGPWDRLDRPHPQPESPSPLGCSSGGAAAFSFEGSASVAFRGRSRAASWDGSRVASGHWLGAASGDAASGGPASRTSWGGAQVADSGYTVCMGRYCRALAERIAAPRIMR